MTEPAPSGSKNAWRLETPGHAGWTRTARPDDPNKYFMVSSDCHATETRDHLSAYIDPWTQERTSWRGVRGQSPDLAQVVEQASPVPHAVRVVVLVRADVTTSALVLPYHRNAAVAQPGAVARQVAPAARDC